MYRIFQKPNLLFLITVRCKYINGNPIIMKKFNNTIFWQKLIRAITVIRQIHTKHIVFTKYKIYDKLHRIDGPAYIWTNKHTKEKCEQWFLNGKLHRVDGPAYFSNEVIYGGHCEHWYYNGKIHRENGPAYLSNEVQYGGYCEQWYYDGKLHRTNGPAYICYSDIDGGYREEWHFKGKPHRVGGPAYISHSLLFGGYRELWYCHGIIHREDGPAEILANRNIWYINGIQSAVGYCRDIGFIVQNASPETVSQQRRWIEMRIQTAHKLKRVSIKLKAPLCEEILRELEQKYYLHEPHLYGYDPLFKTKVITVRFDQNPHKSSQILIKN
jgi:hypothetical protein